MDNRLQHKLTCSKALDELTIGDIQDGLLGADEV